jgi:hypothetical protein
MKAGRFRITRLLPFAAMLCLVVPFLAAQTAGGVDASPPATQSVRLGQPAAALNGPWKFHTGDDLAWARPDFDDSNWAEIDLTPPPGSFDRFIGTSGFVPGWTARGYPGYSGFAWYRLRVNVEQHESAEQGLLALKMPDNCDDAYQVYVDGKLIGSMGRFTPNGITVYLTRPRAFALDSALRGGLITIAIRVWMDHGTALMAADAGGLHGPPVLGQNSVIQAMYRLDWDAIDHSNVSHMIQCGILLLALVVLVALARIDRDEPTYLWLGLCCLVTIAILGLILVGDYTNWISRTAVAVLQDDFLFPARIGLWIIFWGHWFRLQRMGRLLHRVTWALVALLALGTAMQRMPLYGSLVPVQWVVWLLPLTVSIKLLLGALLVWVAYRGMSRDRADALLAMPAVALVGIAQYHYELILLKVKVYYFPFGYRIALSQIGIILSLCIITVLLLRRFLHSLREREQWRLEIEQARQVQSLLVPEKPPATPGFAVEAVYRPASTVGGDFFHVRAEGDGSLLVVVGDVSGKGLKAAMTVAAIIGALHNELPFQPVDLILERLNHVLYGQISGFVTCCVTRIAHDGTILIANAGHPAPYLRGEELPVHNGLPLGLHADVSYSSLDFRLGSKEQLMFITDGVIEARNKSGELFGFARTQQLSTGSAESIAQAAQEHGQDDDITVLTVALRQAGEDSPMKVEVTGAHRIIG